ncbi:hypothetical protein CVT24_003555 [Panaeolus cyanescens]|uniref:Uncharacterized protein n=1 Tax=Panaeolus cyanescens TaxID=181874 RepID=A0A409WN33_9AGAR|nr:hypothetical protein CVT24_003555 [Panaeolus cyanescens]
MHSRLNMRVRIRRAHSISSGSALKSNPNRGAPLQLSLTEEAARRQSRRLAAAAHGGAGAQSTGMSPVSPTFGLVRAGMSPSDISSASSGDMSVNVGRKRMEDEFTVKGDDESDEYDREVDLEFDASVNSRTHCLRGVLPVEVNVQRSVHWWDFSDLCLNGTYLARLDFPIPPATTIPKWAYFDYYSKFSPGTFDVNIAKGLGRTNTSTPGPNSTISTPAQGTSAAVGQAELMVMTQWMKFGMFIVIAALVTCIY